MNFIPTKSLIISGLTFAGLCIAVLATQNPAMAGYGAVGGALIASLIEFESKQPETQDAEAE
jgi:hypothetical protein